MIAEGSPRHDSGWLSDPAVDAGFAAAYDGDHWQDGACESGADRAGEAERLDPAPPVAADPAPPLAVDPAPPVVPSQPSPTLTPTATPTATPTPTRTPPPRPAPDPLVRPRLREDRPPLPPAAGRRPPGRALAGAAVSVGGVLLGIGSVFWVTGEPQTDRAAAVVAAGVQPAPTAPVSTAPVPTAQSAPARTETPPPDSAVPAPAPVVPAQETAAEVPAQGPSAPEPTAAEPSSSPVVPVTVLNNSDRDGLADRAARRFEREGWPVQATGNFRGRIPVTTVYYDPGLEASARAFAEAFPGMVRVRPRFSTLPARGVVVVLTREYAA